MMNLSPIQKLDIVLEFLATDRGNANISYIIKSIEKKEEFKNQFAADDTVRILNKLIKDDYVEYEDSPAGHTQPFTDAPVIIRTYWISFEGKVFVETGGYVEMLRKENIKSEYLETAERLRKRNEYYMVFGTWAVAIGAIALVVWEMIKFLVFHKHH